MKEKDWRTYWHDMAPRLEAWMQSKRDREVEQCLAEAFALYSFMIEDFHDQVTRNREIFLKVGSLLVQGHDVVRAIVPAQATLSTTALAALVRISIEIRSTLLFIIRSADAEKFSDRFARFSDVEKVLHHDKRAKGAQPVLSDEEIARIKAMCPEWFAPENRKRRPHWTGEGKTIRDIADGAGLLSDYLSMYSATSLFVHASSRLKHVYSDSIGIGCLANIERCSGFSIIAANHCVELIHEAATYFGVPFSEKDLWSWKDKRRELGERRMPMFRALRGATSPEGEPTAT